MSNVPFDNLTQADFFTSTHRISGRTETGKHPLSDILNDRSQSYLMVFNAYVSRLDKPGEIGDYAPTAFLSKENLNFIIVSSREIRAADQSRFTSQSYQALVTLPGAEVKGTFAGPHRFDLRTFSPAAMGAFIALINANACLVDLPDTVFSGDAILINRMRMESFCLSE